MLLSSRFGALASRHGPRRFMAIGPALMGLGVLWYARVPSTTSAWLFALDDARTYVPPGSYVTDLLPGQILFGIGLALMVAPLTTALMASVPVRNAGVGSAVNNAISRVGPQLAGALIFVVITASFYGDLHARVPSIDVNDPQTRRTISPLNVARPTDSPSADEVALIEAEREASTDAFHRAMLVAAALLAAGAATNAVGIVDRVSTKATAERA
jgi:MFS family permease